MTATSSGSRGVYGAIGSAGEWGLKHGCAVAYTDKGTGSGVHDLATNTVNLQDGTRTDAATAGMQSNFTATLTAAELATFNAANPNRIAIKHAHSQQNPEKDWGTHTLDAVRFAFYVLNEQFADKNADGTHEGRCSSVEHDRHRVVGIERRRRGDRRGRAGHGGADRWRRGRRARARVDAGSGAHGDPRHHDNHRRREAALRLLHVRQLTSPARRCRHARQALRVRRCSPRRRRPTAARRSRRRDLLTTTTIAEQADGGARQADRRWLVSPSRTRSTRRTTGSRSRPSSRRMPTRTDASASPTISADFRTPRPMHPAR